MVPPGMIWDNLRRFCKVQSIQALKWTVLCMFSKKYFFTEPCHSPVVVDKSPATGLLKCVTQRHPQYRSPAKGDVAECHSPAMK